MPDQKITELTEYTAPVSGDLLAIVQTPAGTPATKKITVDNLALILSSGSLARQAIMNGNFDVWQRGTTFTPLDVTTVQLADRWMVYTSKDGGTLPASLSIARATLTAGDLDYSFYYMRHTSNGTGSSLGTNSLQDIYQSIEHGNRDLCGLNKKVTVSFWARSSIASKKLGIYLEQNYGSGGSPTALENIIGTNFTLTSTWTKYSYTFTTNTHVGKTFGTNDDDILYLDFRTQWGATQATTVGAVGAETYGNGTIDIAQVQMCAGDVALPFLPIGVAQELIRCQRYYYKQTSVDSAFTYYGTGIADSTTQAFIVLNRPPVPMRIAPTMTTSGNFAVSKPGASLQAVTALVTDISSRFSIGLKITVASGLTAGQATHMVSNNDTTAYIALDAEQT